MNELLATVTKNGGFDFLSKKKAKLNIYTNLVKSYEDIHFKIPFTQTKK